MAKLSLEEAQKLSADFSSGFGGVCNDVYDAIEEVSSEPKLKALIKRGTEKVKQFEDALGRLGETHARQFKTDYGDDIESLRLHLTKLEEKLKRG